MKIYKARRIQATNPCLEVEMPERCPIKDGNGNQCYRHEGHELPHMARVQMQL